MTFTARSLAGLGIAGLAILGGAGPREAAAIEGTVGNPANGHYYKIIEAPSQVTWAEANNNAISLGGYLVTLTSAEEETWVKTTFDTQKKAPVWAGGTDDGSEGSWRWVSGETWAYSNWGVPGGEPNNSGGSEHWLELDGAKNNFGWNDAFASEKNNWYIVEWDSDPNILPPPEPPAAPSNLRGSVSPGNPIALTWTDNSTNEEVFEVERRTEGTAYFPVARLGPNTTFYEDVSTAPLTTYTYRVRATNAGGPSDYSGEATVTASALEPAPRAPTDLAALWRTEDAVMLWWSDRSTNEIAFEVHRRTAGGAYEYAGKTDPDTNTFLDGDLPPDGEFTYGVRAVSSKRVSGFAEAAVATLPTLEVTVLRGDLKDSPKFGKDSLKAWARFDFLPESPDGLWDPVAEGITIRAGDDARPVLMTLPGGLDTWKAKGSRLSWRSPKGSMPKYSIQVDVVERVVKVAASGLELPAPPANPMRVSVAVGNDGGTARGDWKAGKPGVFRFR